jgi:hypothetical protein
MKYFTAELWAAWQDPKWRQPPAEADPLKLYLAELESLRGRVNDEAFRFFAEADVHDGELLEFQVLDGGRAAPPGQPGRTPATRTEYPVGVVLRVLDGGDKLVWTLEYRQVRRVVVNYPGELFHDEGRGFGDWGYHELSDSGGGFLRHEVLFASGSTLLVEFREVRAHARRRGAAEQGDEADEA